MRRSRKRSVAPLLALVAATAPAVAAAEPPAAIRRDAPLPGPAVSSAAAVARWRHEAVPLGAVSTGERPARARPVGDLSGDGLPDVVAVTRTGDRINLTCRRGGDGVLLKSLDVTDWPYFHPVDPGWRAILLIRTEEEERAADNSRATVRLTATWVERCTRRWTRTFTGQVDWAAGAAASSLPYLRGTVESPTARPAVLIERVSNLTYFSPFVGRNESLVVSGDDGSVLHEGVAPDFVDERAELIGLPDVTGDGLGDYAFAVSAGSLSETAAGNRDRLDAYASDDGRPLWSLPLGTADAISDATSAGDADGDGMNDFILSRGGGLTPQDAQLVSGATGVVKWQHPGEFPTRLSAGDDPTFALWRAASAEGSYWLDVAAVDRRGKRHHRLRQRVGPSAGMTGASLENDVLGDVDQDGVLDVVYRADVGYEDETERSVYLTVSGRRGTSRVSDVRGLLPNGFEIGSATLDSGGDDVWSPSRLTVESGDTGATVARWMGPRPVVQMLAAQLDGDRCPDLLVTTGDDADSAQVFAVSGRTGDALWSLPRRAAYPQMLSGSLPRCASSPLPPFVVSRPRGRIPATGGGAPLAATLAVASAVALARLRRRPADAASAAASS